MIQESYETMPIIAQCTPSGNGALALIRLSGEKALHIATQISTLASGNKLYTCSTHTINYGWVVNDNGEHIDQVLFLVMHAPKTFTGEHTVEITCHNNPFIIEAIIQQAINHGARLAQPGEFSKRAVINNKLDIIQAEAINDLIHAHTHTAMQKSLAQLEGSLSHWVLTIEKKLIETLTFSEASFEFLEQEHDFTEHITSNIVDITNTIQTIKKHYDHQQQLREGIRIAIIGSVNAGKSSLFNALLGKNRAIVTNTPGTTRDTVEAGMYRHGIYITLIDTAGIRQTDSAIEQEGILRSKKEAETADIILLIFDGSQPLATETKKVYDDFIQRHKKKIVLLQSKADKNNQIQNIFNTQTPLLVSSKKNYEIGIKQTKKTLQQKIAAILQTTDTPFLINKRQFSLICALEHELITIHALLHKKTIAHELLSYHLKKALEGLAELTGKTINEKVLDTVFSNFCVGK